MAITGRFLADFSDFMTAVQKADVALKGMETGAGDVTKMLNKMTDSFSGRKIVQEASLMAQTFENLATKGIGLTTKELQKMGAVADEAIAKLRAGGEAIPAGIQKIADAAKASTAAMKALDDQAQSVQKHFAAFSGDQIIAEAHAVAQAVEKIGGASKLTAAEQEKVNKTVTEAIAKYTALGQTAPKALQNLAAATKAVAGPMSSLQDHLKGIQQHVSAFSGDKIIQEATQIARAVEQIGGASKLTATEQAKVNATMTEAIAKYKALGQTAPQAMTDLANATKQVKPALDQATSGIDKMFGALKGAAAAFGIAFSTQAVIGFVSKVFDAASAVKDLSDSLGLSTDAVQKFKYAAEQGGGTIDDVGKAIQKMNQNLAEGAKSTYDALKTLGLGFNEIRRMNPEDAFLAITDALEAIEDPMLRTKLQMELFGKAGAALGASIAGGFRESAEAANFMSQQTIEDLEKAQQAWENLGNQVIIVSGNIIAATIRTVNEVTKTWQKFLIFAANASTMGVGVAASLASATAEAEATAKALEKAAKEQGGLNRELGQTKVEAAAAAEAARKMAEAMNKAATAGVKAFKDYHEGLKNVDETMDKFVSQHLKELGERGHKVMLLLSDDAVKLGLALNQGMVAGKATIEGLGDEFATLGQKIKPIPPQLEDTTAQTRLLHGAMQDLSSMLVSLGRSGGTVGAMLSAIGAGMQVFMQGAAAYEQFADAVGKRKGFDAREQVKNLGVATALFDKNATSVEKWASGVQSGMAVAGGAIEVWAATANQGRKAAGALSGAMAGAKAGAAFGPWGAAIGAAAGAMVGFIRNMNAGRKAVKDFAKTMDTAAEGTGFDELRQKLLAFGEAGEQMWKNLTQKSKNPAQAKAAIDEINKALATMPQRLNEIVGAAAKAGSGLDVAMVPFIEDLIRAGELTEENKNLLLGLPAAGVPSFNEVSAAAEALGLNIDTIGESIKQLKFTDTAETLAKNLDVLARAGADMDAVLNGVKDQLQALVTDALKFGRTLPDSLRPFLQQLVGSGKLTDEFGNQLTDLGALDFAKPLEESVADLIVAMHELVDVIRNDVGGALDDLGKKVARPKIQPEYLPPQGGPRRAPRCRPKRPTLPEPRRPRRSHGRRGGDPGTGDGAAPVRRSLCHDGTGWPRRRPRRRALCPGRGQALRGDVNGHRPDRRGRAQESAGRIDPHLPHRQRPQHGGVCDQVARCDLPPRRPAGSHHHRNAIRIFGGILERPRERGLGGRLERRHSHQHGRGRLQRLRRPRPRQSDVSLGHAQGESADHHQHLCDRLRHFTARQSGRRADVARSEFRLYESLGRAQPVRDADGGRWRALRLAD